MTVVIDDKVVNLGVFSDQCTFCKHFKSGYTCAAFKTIPEKIWLNEVKVDTQCRSSNPSAVLNPHE